MMNAKKILNEEEGENKMDPITQMNNADAANKVYQSNQVDKAASKTDTGEMNQDAFLKLFIESLKIQDPMAPMEQAQMMEQLTQLTMIETVNNMKSAVDKMMENQTTANPLGEYVDLIGKKVKIEQDGKESEGVVISVGKQEDQLMFEMADGTAYNVSSIVGVTSASTGAAQA